MMYIHISSRATEARFGHAWRDDEGKLHAAVNLGLSWVQVSSGAEARQAAAEFIAAAEAIEQLEADSAIKTIEPGPEREAPEAEERERETPRCRIVQEESPGYICTLNQGHDGDHIARDSTGTVVSSWSRAPEATP